ncbi:MAG TPA: DUF1634 domain-containing protein [Terracidiphilus sp.]|nr:DUF1634 domain-containing protein [Terracidiphilus sp.]
MDDHRLEIMIGKLLRTGVLAAAAVVLAGAGVYLFQHHAERLTFHTFVTEPSELRTFSGILRAASQFQGEGLIQFGLLLLIATPVARVGFSVVGFYLERDRLYTVVSLIVLVILAYSLMHAS